MSRYIMAVIGILLTSPLRADDSIHFEESYAGAHRAEFTQVLEQVKTIVPSALAYITGQWNLSNTLHYPLIVIITEHPQDFPAGASAAYVRSVMINGSFRQTLIVDLTHYLADPTENLNDLLYHEMAHAILQDAVIGLASSGIPQWFNEGLAQSVTTEGHDRTAEDFKHYGHTDTQAIICDLNGHVDTFYHGEYNFGCYTEFYLAVNRLIQLGGKDTIANVILGLHNGIPLPDVIRQVTKLNWPAFQQEIARYTHDVFSGSAPIP